MTSEFACILLDVDMPSINGFELCSAIREHGDLADVRIVTASGKAYEADRDKARRLGADGYITKPFRMERLMQSVEKLLGA